MIRIITDETKKLFAHTLEQQFRLRHDIFVKECGWKDFEKDGELEQDQYDNPAATYLAAVNEVEDVVGGFRLYPTTLPHMISSQFPHYVEAAIPQRPDILELTRFGMRKDQRNSRYYFELLVAIQEFGLSNRIAAYTSVIKTIRFPILQGFGFDIVPLGLPQLDGSIAVLFKVNDECITRVRKAARVQYSVFESDLALRGIA